MLSRHYSKNAYLAGPDIHEPGREGPNYDTISSPALEPK